MSLSYMPYRRLRADGNEEPLTEEGKAELASANQSLGAEG